MSLTFFSFRDDDEDDEDEDSKIEESPVKASSTQGIQAVKNNDNYNYNNGRLSVTGQTNTIQTANPRSERQESQTHHSC